MNYSELWQGMMSRSFSPRDWFHADDDRAEDGFDTEVEDKVMWIYHKVPGEDHLWTVGYYSPDSVYHEESLHDTADSAAQRAHWLNGGDGGTSTLREDGRKKGGSR